MRKLFKHYRLTKQIGCKTSRSVYLAHPINDALEKVVVKVFNTQCFTLDLESESFLQQTEKIKQLRHPHIVPILDLGVEQGQPYVVSAYMSNDSLRGYLDRMSQGRLDLQEALTIILQVGQALCYAHEHGFLHGNIKPENIFFDENGKILLADFSLASFIDVTKIDYQFDISTLYTAPEQFIGSTTEKSDQYSLACLAYEIIIGQASFYAQKFSSTWLKYNSELPIPVSDLAAWLPKPIEEVLLKAMANNPSERYSDISVFLETLQTLLPKPAFTSAPASPTPKRAIPFPFSLTQLLENMENQVPLTQLLLERVEKNPASLITLPHQSLELVQSKYNVNTPVGEDHLGILRERQGSPRHNTVWLVFALSSIAILMIVSISYALSPVHRLTPSTPVKGSLTPHTAINTMNVAIPVLPTIQPTVQAKSTPLIQPTQLPPMTIGISRGSATSPPPPPSASQSVATTLNGSFAEQNGSVYNLTNQGQLDWVHWGLNAPTEVDRKSGVQPQISTYSLIGNGTVQRDSTNSGAYNWSDGTPTASLGGNQPSGIYVQGLNNGFTITAPASPTQRTLKVYVGVYHAKGKLTASLNGKTYQDATLEMNDVNRGSLVDNCIYTLVFSGAPSQALTVSYTLMTSGGSDAYVSLQSAALQ